MSLPRRAVNCILVGDVTDRLPSTSDFWDQHFFGIVFVVCVVGIIMLFGLILRILKCLEEEEERRAPASATSARAGQRPAAAEDRTVMINIQTDSQSPAVHGGTRWQENPDELLQQNGLLSATSHQEEFDDAQPAA